MITIGTGDGVTDNAAVINAALAANQSVCLRDGDFIITSALLLNNNNILVLKDCELKLTTNIDNAIRNADFVNGNTNIKIICIGNVVINHNGYLLYDGSTRPVYGRLGVNSFKYNCVVFYKVDGFELHNICVKNQNAFAFLIENCSNGIAKNIKFDFERNIINQDGFHIAKSHDINVDGLTGCTEDDIFSVQAWNGDYYNVAFTDVVDAYNITVRNISGYADGRTYQNSMRILNGDGCKIHDILIQNVHLYKCLLALNIGDKQYPAVDPIASDCDRITIDNIIVDVATGTKVLTITQACQNVTITNFVNNSGKTDITNVLNQGLNVTLNGVAV